MDVGAIFLDTVSIIYRISAKNRVKVATSAVAPVVLITAKAAELSTFTRMQEWTSDSIY